MIKSLALSLKIVKEVKPKIFLLSRKEFIDVFLCSLCPYCENHSLINSGPKKRKCKICELNFELDDLTNVVEVKE